MAIKELFDQAKQHPYQVAVGLFACLVVGGVAGVALKELSDARLGVREERIAVLEERLKLQEDGGKRQKHINRLVQEQMGSLRKGFDPLPTAVTGVRTALSEAERDGSVRRTVRMRLSVSLQTVEQQLIALQGAIANSEALSKSLDVLVSGVVAEEGARYAEAADLYKQAANAGVIGAQARLARLYLEGKGVEKNVDLAARLFERSALLGDLNSKDELVKLYFSGHSSLQNPLRAAAILSIEPRSGMQLATLKTIEDTFDSKEKSKYLEIVESLLKARAAIVQNQPEVKVTGN